MNKQAVNTFKEGLVMDLNPLANDNKSLTNALNATFITLNGNELMLLNDMGNGRINRVRLDEGYIPVGIKEYGGIIYIASYNPETKKGQIGTFPYPKLEWSSDEFSCSQNKDEITLDQLYGDNNILAQSLDKTCTLSFFEIKDNSMKIPLLIECGTGELVKIHSGDSFSITFEDSSFLKSKNVKLSLVIKTPTDYYTISDDKTSILNGNTFIYGGSYSGQVYLQIDLIIYDNFEVDYIINNDGAILYPKAFDSTGNLSDSYNAIVVPLNGNINISNIKCDYTNNSEQINLEDDGTYMIYPTTTDGGYIFNLGKKIIIDSSKLRECGKYISQFKYYIEDTGTIKILLEYQEKNSLYYSDGSLSYIYRFYPIDSIQSNLGNLNTLYTYGNHTIEIVKDGYRTKSGIRYLETNIPLDDIYLLVVSCKHNNQEEVLITRFIYGTSRYNEYYNSTTINDFNNIPTSGNHDQTTYTLGSNLFLAQLLDIIHYQRFGNEWVISESPIRYSEDIIEPEKIPTGFKTSMKVLLRKTSELFIECIPETLNKYIFDKEVFNISTKNINIKILEVNDLPLKSTGDILYTDYNNNTLIRPALIAESIDVAILDEYDNEIILNLNIKDYITFNRYISSDSSDGIQLLDRIIKTIAPVYDPNKSFEDLSLLLAYECSIAYSDVVVCSKNFLNISCGRLLWPCNQNGKPYGNGFAGTYSYLTDEESLTSGSVKLSNLLAALLTHSYLNNGSNTPSIFDIFTGGYPSELGKEQLDPRGAADRASLKFNRSLNGNTAGLEPVHSNEINATDDWMIATCLNIKGKPLPIGLASRCIGKVYDNGHFAGEYRLASNGEIITKRVDGAGTENLEFPEINNIDNCKYINVGKRLHHILSQVFTLLNLTKNIYFVGPSISSINYNIPDKSYIKYEYTILDYNNDIFSFTKTIDEKLQIIVSNILNSSVLTCPSLKAINYIKSIVGLKSLNFYNYGSLVNLDSSLYNHIITQYLSAYDNEKIIDASNNYLDSLIYYLDGKSVINNCKNSTLEDIGIYFDPKNFCFTYDLNLLDKKELIKKSSKSDYDYIIDWTFNLLKIGSFAKKFVTVFKALRENSNIISGITNNYILLRDTSTLVTSDWTFHSNTTGPGVVYLDFGNRGLFGGNDFTPNDDQKFSQSIILNILDLLNDYEKNELIEEGLDLPEESEEDTD